MEIILGVYDDKTIDDIFSLPIISKQNTEAVSYEKINSLYYDTAENDLYKAGILFAASCKKNKWVMTLSRLNTFTTTTWNVKLQDQSLTDFDAFHDKKIKKIIKQTIGTKPLLESVHIAYDRQIRTVKIISNNPIHIAYDQGSVTAGGKTERISEIHMDFESVNISNFMRIVAEMTAMAPLYVETKSKYLRGLCLAGYSDPNVKTTIHVLSNIQDGLTSLMNNQINRIFIAQKNFVQHSHDPESLHRLRVQLRRFRAFLLFAKPVLHADGYVYWRDRLRDWNHHMNLLREIDVLLDVWHDKTISASVSREDAESVTALIQMHRQEISEKLRNDILHGKFTAMMLGFKIWLYKGIFIPESGNLILKNFVVQRLGKWMFDMRKSGAELNAKDMNELHQLRIISKQVRYIIEGFQLDQDNMVLGNLKKLQDDLGIIHDAALYAETFKKMIHDPADKVTDRAVNVLLDRTADMKTEMQQTLDEDWMHFLHNMECWLKLYEK